MTISFENLHTTNTLWFDRWNNNENLITTSEWLLFIEWHIYQFPKKIRDQNKLFLQELSEINQKNLNDNEKKSIKKYNHLYFLTIYKIINELIGFIRFHPLMNRNIKAFNCLKLACEFESKINILNELTDKKCCFTGNDGPNMQINFVNIKTIHAEMFDMNTNAINLSNDSMLFNTFSEIFECRPMITTVITTLQFFIHIHEFIIYHLKNQYFFKHDKKINTENQQQDEQEVNKQFNLTDNDKYPLYKIHLQIENGAKFLKKFLLYLENYQQQNYIN